MILIEGDEMNKKTWIFIIIAVLIILCIGGIVLFIAHHKKNTKELVLTYEINAGIPFSWEIEIEDSDVVELARRYVSRDDNKGAIVGASVYTDYVFKGLKEGETTIIFQLVNINDMSVEQEEKHYVKVDKDLNIVEVE